jgi:hypothetical protein
MKKVLLFAMALFSSVFTFSQTTLISPTGDGGFETGGTFVANGWTAINGANNNWYVGNAPVVASGVYCAFSGTNSTTWTGEAFSNVSHIYKDIAIPAGESKLTFTFKYKLNAPDATYDFLKLFLVSTSTTPVAGTQLVAGQIGAAAGYDTPTTWTAVTFTVTGASAGTTQRVVFSWRTDGVSPHAAVAADDISVTSELPPAPLTGIKTIDPLGAGPNNYLTFTAAINALNSAGPGIGGVTFNVAAGNTFTEDPPAIAATGTVTNPIIFQRNGAGTNPVLASTGGAGTADFGICFTGGDYITFDGIDISATGTTLEYGYLVRNASASDGAMNNTIKNCKITLNRTNTGSIGILQTASASYGGGIAPSASSGANSTNKYYNITIENAYSGIWLYSSSTYYDSDNEIGTTGVGGTVIGASSANDIGNGTTTVYGIYSYYQSGIKIFNTEIRNLTGTSSNTLYGIYLYYSQGNCLVYNNKIHDFTSTYTLTGSSTYGLSVYFPALAVTVYNNILYNFSYALAAASATNYVFGLYATGSSICNIYYNTVRMNLSANVSNAAFYNAMTTCNVANNVFSNFSTAGATSKRYCFYASTAPASSSNNILYIDGAGTNNFVGYGGAADRATLQLFAAATSPTAPVIGREFGSCNFNPNFTSATDLTFLGTTPARYSGIPVAGITTDINGTTRDLTRPTIGAYETTQTLNDKAAPVFSNLSVTSGLTPVISVTLTDNSNSANNATVRLWYRLQGSAGAFTGLDADSKPAGAMNGTYTWNTSLAALSQGIYQYYIAARDDQGAGTGIWAYPMWATTWLGWNVADPPNYTANPDAAANVATFTKQANLAAGTYEVGTDQPVLKKLTDVTAQLATSLVIGNIIYEMNSTYDGTTGETLPIVFTPFSTSGGNWTVTIRVKTAAGARTLSGSSATQILNLNGVNNLIIDGREGGSGSTKRFTILNTNTAGSAIQFINGASNNTIRYCQIKGVETSATLGTVVFSTTTGVLGNSNNLIDYCDIGDGATTPANLIYSSGTSGIPNINNTVSNSNLFNWFLASTTSQTGAINLLTGNSDWTITGNSFYQTATRTYTSSGIVSIININNTVNGFNFTITNNYLGGISALCGGTPMTLSATTGTPVYRLLYITHANGAPSTIQGNTIANIAMTTASASTALSLISHLNGHVNFINNTLGSQTAAGNITMTNSGTSTGPMFMAFNTGTGATWSNINMTGNTIGGISVSTSSTGATQFRIVYSQPSVGSTVTVSNNAIGGTVTNSIVQNTNAIMSAIMILNPSIGNIVTNNIVRNLTHNNTGTTGSLTGINIQSSGRHTITGNTIYRLSSNSTNVASNNAASIVGLNMTASITPGTVVSQNKVFNLANTNATVAGCVSGLYFATPALGQTTISGNLVHSFSTASPTSIQNGIIIPNTGVAMIYNNMIRLGIDSTGASVTNSVQINGINKSSSQNVGIYFNSVYIGGTGVASGTVNSYAFRRITSGTADTVNNNIFINNRSNTSGTGKHYNISTNANTNLICNFNLYQGTGTGAVFGINNVTDYATMAAWRGGTNQDCASGNGDPNYILPAGTSATLNLHVQNPTAIEGAGTAITAITTDYDGAARAGLTPVDIGADAGSFTSSGDIFPPNIIYTPLTSGTTVNRILTNFATITDNIAVSGGASLPRLYFKKSTDNDAFVGNTSADNGWKYVIASNSSSPYSFTIDYSIINGGLVINGDIIQYFVVAQDAANNLAANFGGAAASGNPPVQNISTAPATPLSYTISGGISGTLTVGTTGTYPSLTGAGGAFAAINAATVTSNLIVQIVSDLAEDGTYALNAINEDPFGSNFTVTIQSVDANERVISGAVANGMIRFNGATRVTVDGRFGGSGRYLRFRNTNTSNPTFTFINDAIGNTIRNCYIEGANTGTTSGVVLFSTSTGVTGNDNNTINSNIIRDRSDVAGVPYNLVYASGTVAKENSGNTFTSNEFFNFTNAAVQVSATGTGNGWVFTGNSIYQTAPRTTALYGIYVQAGNGHLISGNNFGGSNATRTGAALTTASNIYGVYLTVGNSTPTSVQGNTLSNFGGTGSSGIHGVYITSGSVNIGTVAGNTFGGGALPSDTIQNTMDNGIIYSSSTDYINIENNTIGNISYYRNAGDRTCGIYVSGSAVSIKNNIIRDIKSNSTGTAFSFLPVGILISTTLASNIEGNTIYNIFNSNPGTSAYTTVGILNSGNWANSTVKNNYIYNIKSNGTGTGTNSPQIYGIYNSAGFASFYNNLISIGTGTTPETRIYGIQDLSTGVNTYYYNSVNIYGTASGSNASYGFLKSAASFITLNNNIFNNARTGGSIKPYAIGLSTTTGFTSNYNNIYSSGTQLGLWGATDKNDLTAWKASATPQDANTLAVDPQFASPTDLRTCKAELNGAGTTISGITTDYSGATRGTPPDIGAYEFSIPLPTITGSTPLCQGSAGNLYNTESGMSGYNWTVSAGGSITAGSGTNQITVTWNTAGAQTVSVNYANANGCSALTPTVKNITIDPVTVGGTIAGGTNVCTGTNSTLLTLSGHTGAITKWQWSTDNWVTPNDIVNTAATYTATNLTVTTKYRAVITSGVCSSANSADATVTVDPASVGGSIAGSATVCSGINSTLLTLSGYTGSITKWQWSTDNWVTPNDIVNTAATYTVTNISTTTRYRAVITSGVCSSANSADATVTVDPTSVGGSIAGSATVCTGTNSTLLTLSGYTGSITKWQWSTDNWVTPNDIVNTVATYTATNLTATTKYRAVITSGVCSSINSAEATVTVDPASVGGSIAGSATVCSGTNSTLLTLSGYTGSITKWQWSTNNWVTPNDIVNTTAAYTAINLTATTKYRAVITSGVCSSAISADATVTVDPVSTGGSIAGSTNVCKGINSTLLTLSGYTGSITKWQSSVDNWVTPVDITNTTTTYTATNLTITTKYRAVITSGVCSSVNSADATVTVDPTSVGGGIAGSTTVCSGTNSTLLTLSGYTGSITKWQWSTDNWVTPNDIVNTAPTYTATNLTATTKYRAVITSGTCASANSADATVTVDPVSVGGSIAGSAAVCSGVNSTLLTLSGYTGTITKWQYSTNNWVTPVDIVNTAATYTATNLTTTTKYRAVIQNGVCSSAYSAEATVTVNPLPVPNVTGPSTCVSGTSGNIYSTEAGMTGYAWTITAGGTIDLGQGTNSISVTWTGTGAQSVSVTYTNTNSCSAATPTVYPVTVTAIPGPAGPITGTPVVCQNQNGVAYSIAPVVNATSYVWTLPAGATIATGNNTNAITVNFSTVAASGNMSVYGTNALGDGAPSPNYAVTVNTMPNPTIAGVNVLCAGATGITYTTEAGMTAYAWTVSAGGSITAGATTNQITVTWSTSGSKTVTVNYNNANGCSAAIPSSYSVTVKPLPVPGISGAASVCVGTTGVVYTTDAGMSNYIWTVSAGGTVTSGGGVANNTVTVTWNTAGAQMVEVNYTAINGCPGADDTNYPVTVNPLPVPTITGLANTCIGGVNIYTTEAAMTGYNWTVSAGGTITAGAGTNTITVQWTVLGAQTVSVNYVNGNGCTATAATVKNVTVNTLPVPTITGTTPVCAGTIGLVYTTEAAMTGYTWTISAGGTITAGAGTNAITVTWNSAGAQTVSVNYTNGNGCSAAAATVKNITVNALPVPTVTGTTSVCAGTTGWLYSTEAGMSGYTWTISAGGAITLNAGNTIMVTWNTAGAQWVKVNYINGNGCTAVNPTQYDITVNPLPVPVITGAASSCVGTTGVVYTTTAGMTNYSWSVSPGGVNTSGGTATDNTITVTWTTAGAQWIRVNYTNGNGCTAAAPTQYNVTVNPLPVPTITGPASICMNASGSYTTEAGMTGYIWTVVPAIPPANITGQGTASVNIIFPTAAAYTVSVNYVNGNGCTATAATVKNVTVNALPVPTITGLAAVCVGTSGVIYTTEAAMTGYTWTISAGGTITAGAGTNAITVTWITAGAQTVSVNYTNANSCSAATATVKPVTVNPLPVPTITGLASVCAGTTGVTYSTETTMTGYSWTVSAGGTITAGAGTNAITVTWTTAGAQTVSVNYTNGNGCTATTATVKSVTVNPLPVPTITGLASVCVGTAGVIYTTEALMTGYTWTISAGGTITAGAGTNAITVTWTTAGSQNVYVNYVNANGCTATIPTVKAVTVNPLPAPTITGLSSVCVGTTGVTYTTEAAMTGYTWSVSAGGTVTAGAGTSAITVTWNTAGAQTVSVNYINGNGCTAATATVKSVTVNPLPVPVITGPASICVTTTGNVYTTQTGMTGYTWTVSAGGTITAGAGTNAITVTWNTAGAQNVYVNYINANGCTATSPTVYPVTVNTRPVPTITGPATVCAATPGNIYTTEAGMTGYVWTVSAGGIITAGAGTSSITVTWNTAGAQTVTANYNNASGCNALAATSYPVTVNTRPTPTITGPAGVCVNSTGNVYTTQTGMTGYTWTVSAGGTITAGAGTNAITVTWSVIGAQSVTVNYTNASGCNATSATIYNVTVNGLPSPTITGSNNLCVNSGYYNYTTEAGMTGYVWTISAGGTITWGAGTSQIQVTWNTAGAQSVSVIYTNPAGCSPATPTTLPVTVNPMPGAAGSITGTAAVCGGAVNVAYSIAPVANAVNYVWTLPAGATIASGFNTNSITVNFATNASSGNITAQGNNLCGNGVPSPPFAVTVTALPAAAGTITGQAAVCQGAMGVVYSVGTIANATSYTWTVPSGATIVSGGTTNSITVDFGLSAVSGNITVLGTNSCGAGTISPPYAVTVNPIPATPVVTASNDTLTSSAATGNQWYYSVTQTGTGTIIPGATGQTHIATQSGWYWSIVTLSGCSSDPSNRVNIIMVGQEELTRGSFNIYPVPNDGKFTISITSPTHEIYSIGIYNKLGQKIFELRDLPVDGKFEQTIDLRPLPNGIYTVVFENGELKVVRKVLVNK